MNTELYWDSFNQYIKQLVDFSDEENIFCRKRFYLHSFPKGTYLVEPGSICSDLFFIVEGLCRNYFVNDKGDECTVVFTFENDFSTNYNSFLQQTPSNHYIQALEPITAIVLPRDSVYEGYRLFKEGEKLGRLLAEKYYIHQTNWLHDLYSKDVLTRYEDIIKKYPSIYQRIPQHMIASYLNITPVHLSRILKKRFINK